MRKALFAVLVLLAFGDAAFAQHNGEVSLNYSLVRFVPQNNSIVPSVNLNGGGGAGVLYFAGIFGIKAEFQGYGSSTSNFVFPAGSLVCPAGCTASAQGNLFTYNVGPTIKIRVHRFQPFVEALFGGAHSNLYGNVFHNCVGCVTSSSPSNNAFDFIIGGGVDIRVTTHFAVRPVEFNYLLTRFGNAFTHGNNNQSNFRYQAGVVFMF